MKCNMCLRNYNAANFSEKQKTDARWQISKQGRITTNPRCFKCTGGQLVEIECSHCHNTKGLEDFAKSQRRKPGDAVCMRLWTLWLVLKKTSNAMPAPRYNSHETQLSSTRRTTTSQAKLSSTPRARAAVLPSIGHQFTHPAQSRATYVLACFTSCALLTATGRLDRNHVR